MAVTTAIPEGEEKKDHVGLGASGGFAPEGYGLRQRTNVIQEDVANRSKEQEEKRVREAEEFNKAKKEALESAKDPKKATDSVEKSQEKLQEKASKKPTATGVNVDALTSGVGTHDPKTTEKLEKQDVKASQPTTQEKK
jgi:FKBP-type peptidyl-prolyl cis-trans isomerase